MTGTVVWVLGLVRSVALRMIRGKHVTVLTYAVIEKASINHSNDRHAQANVQGSAHRLDRFRTGCREGRIRLYIGDLSYFMQYVLRTDETQLRDVLRHVWDSYRTFSIPKDGGTREIQAIDRESRLYAMQKALCRNFLYKISLPVPVVGFVREESYLSFLKPHVGKRYFLRLDIRNFFDSITETMVLDSFGEFFSQQAAAGARWLAELCTLYGRLPQGAVTSPVISNIVFRRADQRILKYCQRFDNVYVDGRKWPEDLCYTRYADDLLFSSNVLDFSKARYFSGMISAILKDHGFSLNHAKTRYGTGQITLSGFVLGDDVHLSRKKLYSLSKLLHFFGKTDQYCNKKYRIRKSLLQQPDWLEQVNRLDLTDGHGALKRFDSVEVLLNYLCGYRSFLLAVLRCNESRNGHMEQLERKLRKLEMVICAIIGVTYPTA